MIHFDVSTLDHSSFIRSFVRSFVRSLARSSRKFLPTRKIRRRELFWKKGLGRCDRFHQKIVESDAVLAIFEPFIILRGMLEMSCVEHTTCSLWNTRNVLRGTHETYSLEHKKHPAWNARNSLFGTWACLFCLFASPCAPRKVFSWCHDITSSNHHSQRQAALEYSKSVLGQKSMKKSKLVFELLHQGTYWLEIRGNGVIFRGESASNT